jgi:hypothetical protein
MGYRVMLIVAIACFAIACNKTENKNPVPSIVYNGITKKIVTNGFAGDTVIIQFIVNDGDADLGNGVDASNHDIFVKDSRSTFIHTSS